jgi:hypothetical protein
MEEQYRASDARTKRLQLYCYGTKPDPKFVVHPGIKQPSADEAILQRVSALKSSLEEHVRWADAIDAPKDSRLRREVRNAQRGATEMVDQELRRLHAEYSGQKALRKEEKR